MVAQVYVFAFAAAFFLSVIGFAVGVTWVGTRSEAHTPRALRSDDAD